MAGRVSIVGWAVLVVCAVVGLVSCSGGRAPVDASGCEIDWTERDVGRLHVPQEIAVGPSWETYLLDRAGMLWEIDIEQRVLRSAFGCRGEVIGQFGQPTNLGVAPDGAVWVTYPGEGLVVEFLGDGEVGRSLCVGRAGDQCTGVPTDVAFEADGTMWAVDQTQSQVVSFAVPEGDGEFTATSRVAVDGPFSLAVTPEGSLLVVGLDELAEVVDGEIGGTVELAEVRSVEASPDGRVLVTGGVAQFNRVTGYVREWSDGLSTGLAEPGAPDEWHEVGVGGRCVVGAPAGVAATSGGGFVFVDLGDNAVYFAEPDCAAIHSVGNGGRR
ncbi:MAG: hypothetical protein RIE08_08815 [Acidimicrobiales bacterium]